MLIKLLPEQIIKEWEVIKYAIQASVYEEIFDTSEAVRNHLREALLGVLQVWAVVQDEQFVGIGISRFSVDGTLGIKRLEIYCLYSYEAVSMQTWATCFVVLKRFAKANGCKHIIALTDQARILEMAAMVGGNASQRFLVFDV